jgi:Tfp pilus tip-associated adhesin PilY1
MRFKFQTVADSYRDEEKMVSAPKVVGGVAFFGTNTPQTPDVNAGVCSNLGVARAYAIDPFSGAPSIDRNNDGVFDGADFAASIVGGGLPPSVTAGIVKVGDSFFRFVIGAGGNKEDTPSPVDAAKGATVPAGPRSRVYWYYPADDR